MALHFQLRIFLLFLFFIFFRLYMQSSLPFTNLQKLQFKGYMPVFEDQVCYKLAKKTVLIFRAMVFSTLFFLLAFQLLKKKWGCLPSKQHITEAVLIEGQSCAYRCLCISVHSLTSQKLSNRNSPPCTAGFKDVDFHGSKAHWGSPVENGNKKFSLQKFFWESLLSTGSLTVKLFFLKLQGNKYYGSVQWNL